ncbi:2-aminoethylphosphonate--pyruvate transaminase [Pengzhenrongella sicca]|uniref:2-aminoethylphosphonate--pyruvate transaminase n=1 Tax=Pengzhenrongella sicca TaxID=2819238 RepID=A0A8A4ZDW2_9MICO|nr:2-aminoethylphosphonate--pyruvate transaminase [Pengzhenrongella sicca]QTE30094.1 2-aminoethylphosphonate--pyruvate transaminase [Pengzhenrongella sicca]
MRPHEARLALVCSRRTQSAWRGTIIPAPKLLTPGPLTTSDATRRAMLTDWGSWDPDFAAVTREVCAELIAIASTERDDLRCVPLQGSGTFAVEAAVRTLVPPGGSIVVLVNGAYGRRMADLCRRAGRVAIVHETADDVAPDPADLAALLAAHPEASHVGLVHCETSTGLLNPLGPIADVVAAAGRRLIVDAMSSFGVLPVHAEHPAIDAIVAASGKGLEGVPGMGFVLAPEGVLLASAGRCDSLALDLSEQYSYLTRTGQWRFTPPTHVVAGLQAALAQYRDEGGITARRQRYQANGDVLLGEMTALGFRSFLPAELQAPIIYTFHAPRDDRWDFPTFYREVKARGFILYPGKLTRAETFRVGCIGAVTTQDLKAAVAAIADSLAALGVVRI